MDVGIEKLSPYRLGLFTEDRRGNTREDESVEVFGNTMTKAER